MTAQFLDIFPASKTPLEASRQEYALAKRHFREVCRSRRPGDPEGRKRFQDALDRQAEAMGRFLRIIRG